MNGDMTAFKRHYTPYIRRCDDLEKKLKFFEDEMTKHGIVPEEYTPTEFASWASNQRDTLSREHRGLSLLDYWESIINERHRDYVAIKAERDATAASLYQSVQRRLVIEHAKNFFLEAVAGGYGSDVTTPPAGVAGTEPGAFSGWSLAGARPWLLCGAVDALANPPLATLPTRYLLASPSQARAAWARVRGLRRGWRVLPQCSQRAATASAARLR